MLNPRLAHALSTSSNVLQRSGGRLKRKKQWQPLNPWVFELSLKFPAVERSPVFSELRSFLNLKKLESGKNFANAERCLVPAHHFFLLLGDIEYQPANDLVIF